VRNPFKKSERDPLEVRVERLERAVRDVQADWDTTYDKFAMMLKRWTRREKDAVHAMEGPPARRDFITRTGG